MKKILLLFHTFFAKIKLMGKGQLAGIVNISISTRIAITNKGSLQLGKRVETLGRVGFFVCGGILKIGQETFFNHGCMIACRESIVIGKGCSFGPNVVIYDHDHRFDGKGYHRNEYRTAPVIIGDNCWIGANVTILRGAKIGAGCVLGAGTVIQGEIPAYSLVKRGTTPQIVELLSLN